MSRWEIDPRAYDGSAMDVLIVPCPHCGRLSRLPRDRSDDVPICASCRTRLFGRPVDLDAATFDRVARGVTLPLVVDFWADWCAPCHTMAPEFATAAQELAGHVVFAKVNTEADTELAEHFQIRSIPTIVLLQNGAEVRRISGALSRQQILEWIAQGGAAEA